MKVLNWIIALCGLWELGDIVLPFVIGSGNVQAFVWNHIIVGMVLVTICFITLMLAIDSSNDYRVMEKCLQTYTPRACAVLEMSATELEKIEDE